MADVLDPELDRRFARRLGKRLNLLGWRIGGRAHPFGDLGKLDLWKLTIPVRLELPDPVHPQS